jgi:hypothetical protein
VSAASTTKSVATIRLSRSTMLCHCKPLHVMILFVQFRSSQVHRSLFDLDLRFPIRPLN